MRQPLLVACLALASCNRDSPPAPTAEQSAQLNEAEEMLNAEAGAADNQPNASNAANETSPTTTSSGTANLNQAP